MYLTSTVSTFVKYVSCAGDEMCQGPITLMQTVSLPIIVCILFLEFITPRIRDYFIHSLVFSL